MTCDRFRPQLALLVGNDLDSREASEVRQHLTTCPACQAHRDALQASMGILRSVSRQTPVSSNGHSNERTKERTSERTSESLWPVIQTQLASQRVPLSDPAPSWFTVGAFTAACAAVMWLTFSTPVFDFSSGDGTEREIGIVQPRDVGKPVSSRLPDLHLVDDAQPPVQIFSEGDFLPRMVAPPSSFGDPRSF